MRKPTPSLDKLLECAIDWGADFRALIKVDSRHSTLANALWSEFKFLCIVLAMSNILSDMFQGLYLVNILVSTTGTESVQPKLLIRIPLPAHGRHNLNA